MTQTDYSKIFSCPRCGTVGTIYLLKVAGSNIIIKQRCPKHGGRSYKVPLLHKDLFINYIRDSIFRCYKCGEEAELENVKQKGPWTLIRCSCPRHGNDLPFQKIWNSIYAEISSEVVTKPVYREPAQPEPVEPSKVESTIPESTISEKKEFCPNCGEPLKGYEKFCGTCGSKLE